MVALTEGIPPVPKTEWNGDGVRLILGDCLDILPELPAASVHAVIADPPYGTTACKWDSVIPLEPMWAGLKHVAKERAAIVLTASQPFTTTLIASNMKWFKYCWVWDKVNRYTGVMNANMRPLRIHEDVVIFHAKQPVYNKQFRQGSPYAVTRTGEYEGWGVKRTSGANDGQRHNPCSIIAIKGDVKIEGNVHPTQKPVALMAYLIRTYTNEGETVLDFTMGSGTTGVAAIRENRKFVGIEKDPEYFNIARERIERELREQRIQPKLF